MWDSGAPGRTAIPDTALAVSDFSPDQGSFTIALNTTRDQLVHATGIIACTTIDLIGTIGRAVLDNRLPACRNRTSPRVVKRAISKHRAKGKVDRNTYKTQISVHILPG
jgi:hypothetical protein